MGQRQGRERRVGIVMATLTAAQRQEVYHQEAARTGIHAAILAALDAVHHEPHLATGETGLGIAPVQGLTVDQVGTFAAQVYYAANSIRSLTDRLTATGWEPDALWDAQQHRYADRFIAAIAQGYVPPVTDTTAARLEAKDGKQLLGAYLASLETVRAGNMVNHATLDEHLLATVEQLPRLYHGLSYQRAALLEMFRLWRKLETTAAALEFLEQATELTPAVPIASPSEIWLDRALTLVRQVRQFYAGYPHQRAALLGLIQHWRQAPAVAPVLASLRARSLPQFNRTELDAALMAQAQQVIHDYQGYGDQRLAVTEAFQHWHALDSRTAALQQLGINPADLNAEATAPDELEAAAAQVDRALLTFLAQIPIAYAGTDAQQTALLHLTQRWHDLAGVDVAIQQLVNDLQRMERANRESLDAPPRPRPMALPDRPSDWTPDHLVLMMAIVPHGSFTWADSTQGGLYLPPNAMAIAAITHMATALQTACDRLGRSVQVVQWYVPEDHPTHDHGHGNPYHRHALGDGVLGFVPGLTANQVYWALDPWWPGGLARFTAYPYLIYLDGRSTRARWQIGV